MNHTNGHIHLHTLTELHNKSTILVSGETYETFNKTFVREFEMVRTEYNLTDGPIVTYASYLYDQLWAFALAVNNSLPVLKSRNLSISNYTIGQKTITTIIENELANMSFQGAGGLVQIQYGIVGVNTPVEVNWIMNGTERFCWSIQSFKSNQLSSENSSKLTFPRCTLGIEIFVIPLPGSVILCILATAVITLYNRTTGTANILQKPQG